MCSNSLCSLSKPALHVGKQIGGGDGWRATAGRAGIAGGSTTGGGDGGDTVAQPLASISSGSSISAGALQGLVGFIGGFLHICCAASFFGACGQHGFSGIALQVGDVLGMLGASVGMSGLFTRQAVGLQADSQQGRDQQADPDPADGQGLDDGHSEFSGALTF